MHDGPENGPRRSRRSRTDDASPVNGGMPDGPDDDVLDRYGLRDASTSRDEGPGRRREADEAPPWPPRTRRDPGFESGVDRTDALPSVADAAPSGASARRRLGVTDSRHTQVMPVTPRRRARDDDPEPPADGPPARPPQAGPPAPARPGVPPDPGPPTAAPSPAAPPNGVSRGSTTPGSAPPNGAAAPNAVPPSPPADGRPTPDADTPGGAPRTPSARAAAPPPATGRPAPEPDAPPERTSRPAASRSSESGRAPAAAVDAAPDADLEGVETEGAGEADGRAPKGRPANGRRRPTARPVSPPEDPPPPPAGPGRRLLRIGTALVAVVVFAACASGFSSRETVEDGLRTVPALDPGSDAISQRAAQTGDENVLVLGLPADRAGVPEAARGDTAVLVHLPAGGAPAVTIGFPPTLEVARPPCRRWDGATGAYGDTVPAESRTAFSAAYDVGGPKCAVGVVQQVTGLAVTRFVALDLAGVNALVGAVRGVGVCTERPVVDRALGPVATRPGDTVLGGSEAERFTAATGVDDTTPADRIRRQQRVLSAVMENALSTTSLLSPGASDRVARALPGALTVDGAEAEDLLVLSRSLSRTTGEDAAPPYVSVPVNEQPNTRGHLEVNRGDSSDLFTALQKHEPLPPAFTVPAQRGGTLLLPPGTVVDVLNGTGRSGLADEIATALRAQGYAIGAVGDAPPAPDTTIRFSPDRADASGVLAGSVRGARAEADPAGTGKLQVVLGASFPGATAIGAPASQASPPADCG